MPLHAHPVPACRSALPGLCAVLGMGALMAPGLVVAQGYADFHGEWRGSVMVFELGADGFQVGRRLASDLWLRIGADGQVSGQMPRASCGIQGSALPYRSNAHAQLAVQVDRCTDPRVNGRYEGRLLTSEAHGHASLRLRSATAPVKADGNEISGILQR
ncbi:hypothetical protein [uncultured Pseudacidovorax sp.]|uniref:hypothetical protein n=1 Tax=uncultured Pseudacidovorax sp. TaxID=679313 RepID=UPI0025D14308|nr:hypothetical protein [uncultured Pseudacidovorax sp.]